MRVRRGLPLRVAIFRLEGSRITSYNVCYTKLLREKEREKAAKAEGKEFVSSYVEKEEEDAEIIISYNFV